MVFGVWGLGFEVLGFGVWCLGFGVWGLGFGVWDLGFRETRSIRHCHAGTKKYACTWCRANLNEALGHCDWLRFACERYIIFTSINIFSS